MSATLTLEGEVAMRRRLLGMSASVQGQVMIPPLRQAGERLQQMAKALAPRRTGALTSGIVARLLKSGYGYAQLVVTLEPAVYYGRFQEFGLGSGAASMSARTKRRRAKAGRRTPNMAAHPFMRPAVKFFRESLRTFIVQQLEVKIREWAA